MLTSLLTSFGLGFASGYRAVIPALVLGALHHSPWFELDERFAWLASPPVLVLLAVIGIVEVLADRHPESAELVALGSWLPKAVLAFIAVAAAVGEVDQNVMALAGSGLLGAAVAVATDRAQVAARKKTRELADAGAVGADRAVHHVETGAAATVAAVAVLHPWLSLVVIAGVVVLAIGIVFAARAVGRAVQRGTGLKTGEEPQTAG